MEVPTKIAHFTKNSLFTPKSNLESPWHLNKKRTFTQNFYQAKQGTNKGAKKVCNDQEKNVAETKPMLFPCWKFDHVLVNVGQAQEKTFEKGGQALLKNDD